MWTEITPPGGGPPLHRHLNEDELFVAQEGKVAFFYDDQWHDLGPGGVAFIARESIHTFKNTGMSQAGCSLRQARRDSRRLSRVARRNLQCLEDLICSVLPASPSNTGSIF